MRISMSALVVLAGCTAVTEDLSPLGADAGDAGQTTIDAGTGGSGAGGSGTGGILDAGPPKRVVMQRNPYGNVAETENLLWDGDFEWHSAFSDQYGWLAGSSPSNLGYEFTDIRLGAACRSGIKCAGMKKNRVIAGLGVASLGGKIQASFWAKTGTAECAGVSASIISFDSSNDPDVMIKPISTSPDVDGWCQYESVMDPRTSKPVLFIQNQTGVDIVIDDAVIKKVVPEMSVKAHHGPPSAALAADLDDARAAIRRTRGPHDPPPNAARRAFEGRKGKRP